MTIPAGLSVSPAMLKLDPVWNPLRSEPAFQALLKKYTNYHPAPTATSSTAATTATP